jgi:hypothetical protein
MARLLSISVLRDDRISRSEGMTRWNQPTNRKIQPANNAGGGDHHHNSTLVRRLGVDACPRTMAVAGEWVRGTMEGWNRRGSIRLDKLAQELDEIHQSKRLLEDADRAQPNQICVVAVAGESRDEDSSNLGIDLLQFSERLGPVLARHANVEHDCGDFILAASIEFDGLASFRGDVHAEAVPCERNL